MTSSGKIGNAERRWGGLYEPGAQKVRSGNGLRVVLFGSATGGLLILDSLIRFEQKYPGILDLAGVATDDPVDPNARISLKKRIWNNYTPAESANIMNRMVSSCLNGGVACFTGNVKSDYFRKIFTQWDPEVLIMNCFGQKLDAFLYEYPALGAFNFHPSNLSCNIGIGAQPFQDIMLHGLDTSPMVIHKVTEIIDAGPVIGISPEINIRLKDGSYPLSLLTLLEKINSISGWMSTELIVEILDRQRDGSREPLTVVDFDQKIPEEVKRKLLAPATNDLSDQYELPLHPKLL